MTEFISSTTLLLLLLNPFLLIVYLVDVVEKLQEKQFGLVLLRAGLIASVIFCCFAILGDVIFSQIIKVEFASFRIFGGIIFLLIGIQFIFRGPRAIEFLRGDSEFIADSIAMPVLIGPGTISASVIIGQRHTPVVACMSAVSAVVICLVSMLFIKWLYDMVKSKNEGLIKRYIQVAGHVTAFYIGTVAIEMIMQGIKAWMYKF